MTITLNRLYSDTHQYDAGTVQIDVPFVGNTLAVELTTKPEYANTKQVIGTLFQFYGNAQKAYDLYSGRDVVRLELPETDKLWFSPTSYLSDNYTLTIDYTDVGTIVNGSNSVSIPEQILGLPSRVTDLETNPASNSWANITNKPLVFSPNIHFHDISEVAALQIALGEKSDVGHLHSISNIDSLQTSLDGIDSRIDTLESIPFVAQSSGTGAFQLQPTDSTAVGGNARGANAIDLQKSRTLATQVASGASSFAVGESNTVPGAISFALGLGNIVSGSISFASGIQNTISRSFASAFGANNTVNSSYSSAFGFFANTKLIENLFCFSSAPIAFAAGVNQASIFNIGAQTTNATPTVLRSNTEASAPTNQLALQDNSALVVKGLAIATMSGAGDTKSWEVTATIKRGANAASTVLQGTPIITVLHQSAGASSWTIAITADTTNGCLAATVTNGTGTVRVNLSLFASEVAF